MSCSKPLLGARGEGTAAERSPPPGACGLLLSFAVRPAAFVAEKDLKKKKGKEKKKPALQTRTPERSRKIIKALIPNASFF